MISLVEKKIIFFKFTIENDKNSMEMQKKDIVGCFRYIFRYNEAVGNEIAYSLVKIWEILLEYGSVL